MKIRTPDFKPKPKRPKLGTYAPPFSANSDKDHDPLPLKPPDVRTRADMGRKANATPSNTKRSVEWDADRRKRQSDAQKRAWARRRAEGTDGFEATEKRRKLSPRYEAEQHTLWIRKDIWSALGIYTARNDRTLRSIVEEALYVFLIKEGRVTDVNDLGEEYGKASWVKEKE